MDEIAAGIKTDAAPQHPALAKEILFRSRGFSHPGGEFVEPDRLFLPAKFGRVEPAFKRGRDPRMIERAGMFDRPSDPEPMGNLASNGPALQVGLAPDESHDAIGQFHGLGHVCLLRNRRVANCYLNIKFRGYERAPTYSKRPRHRFASTPHLSRHCLI